jgi:hypothetical protein
VILQQSRKEPCTYSKAMEAITLIKKSKQKWVIDLVEKNDGYVDIANILNNLE